ncbi:MAG: M15 family metallopeptidase [Candidatus Omnitrophica bacterium]|nr:M15 family metallopeptidase [Candidatus Omnitrophota bacterium]MCM8777326.1 M15 family metallopeptidase [Candidatus Omnitrophota bacterium]
MIARVRIIILTVLCASFIVSTHSTELVDVREVIPDIILDIRYATPDNFTGKVLYPSADCFLAKEVALALKKVQDDLKTQGYRLKIFDGYRPLSVQREMWKVFPNSKYVANPKKGSVHNRGYAVDLTIVSLDGSPVAMPTDFDKFTEKAHTNYKDLPQDGIKHREILKKTMERYGFISIKTEWWHFNYRNYKRKPVLDIPFEVLKR